MKGGVDLGHLNVTILQIFGDSASVLLIAPAAARNPHLGMPFVGQKNHVLLASVIAVATPANRQETVDIGWINEAQCNVAPYCKSILVIVARHHNRGFSHVAESYLALLIDDLAKFVDADHLQTPLRFEVVFYQEDFGICQLSIVEQDFTDISSKPSAIAFLSDFSIGSSSPICCSLGY